MILQTLSIMTIKQWKKFCDQHISDNIKESIYMFKRLSNHVSPFTHNVVTSIVKDSATRQLASDEAHLVAKQLLADLPLVPTGGLVLNLTQQIQFGLLDEVCPIENVHEHWQECLDLTTKYLKGIGIWETF